MLPTSLPHPPLGLAPGRRPRVWTVFVALALLPACLLAVAFISVLGAMMVASYGMPRGQGSAAVDKLLKSTLGATIADAIWASLVLAVAILCAKRSNHGIVSRLALGPSRATALDLVLGSIGAVAASSAIHNAVAWLAIATRSFRDPGDSTFLNRLETEQTSHGIGLTIAIVAVIGIFGSIAEEVFFRGYVQTRLRERWGPAASIAIASFAFGLYHLPSPAYALFAAFLGAYLGWLANFAGGTRPAMLAHAVNNTIAVVLAMMAGRFHLGATPRASFIVAIPIATVVAMACIAAMVVLRAIRARRAEMPPARRLA
jgi:uncharacterized protein